MSIKNRVDQLEAKAGINNTNPIKRIQWIIVNSPEQVQHPERFKVVIDEIRECKSGINREIGHYEHK